MDFLNKLASGYYGLAKTFWIWSFLGGIFLNAFIISLIFMIPATIAAVPLFILIMIAYMLITSIGTWNASNVYDGFKLWSMLAKISVVMTISTTLLSLVTKI